MRAPRPPYGAIWLHEIKHDGFRAIARKDGLRVKIYSRPGNELTHRFPLLVEALARLRARSCIIDGKAVACGEDSIALFERIRYRRFNSSVFMYAFDLIELNGDDLRGAMVNPTVGLPRCLGLRAETKRRSEKPWPKSERPNGEPGTKVLRSAKETASRRIR